MGLLVLTAASGCGEEGPSLRLLDWQLDTGVAPPTLIRMPTEVDGMVPRAVARFTLRTRIEVPPNMRARPLTVSVPSWAALVTAHVGGKELDRYGEDRNERYRSRGPLVWKIPASAVGAELEIELHVRNEWTRSSWYPTVPRLSTRPDGDAHTAFVTAFNDLTGIVGAAVLATMALVCLVLFLLHPALQAYGWLAIAHVNATYYILYCLGVTQIIGVRFESPLLGVTLGTSIITSVYGVHSYYRLKPPSRAWVGAWAALVLSGVLLSDPFISTRWFTPFVLAVLVTGTIYQVVLHVQMASRRHLNALINLACWLFIGAFAVPDVLAWLSIELLRGVRVAPAALAIFSVLQLIAISRTHILSLRNADRLNEELEALNTELRRQIAERSRNLSHTLASMSSHADASTDIQPGSIIDERYAVVSAIGSGAVGRVLNVSRLSDGRSCAMKILHEQRDARLIARFAREAQLAAEIHHPNVVELIDVGIAPNGLVYIVMECVPGPSLQECADDLRRSDQALHVLRDIAAGLAAVHDHGVVHRDLKPSNVLIVLTDRGRLVPKIADFGISGLSLAQMETHADAACRPPTPTETSQATRPEGKRHAARRRQVRITEPGAILGTPAYMAPEIAHGGESAMPSSDIYSFGVLAYELLTGVRPPKPRIAARPQRLLQLRSDLPPTLAALIEAARLLDPDSRPSAEVLHRAFAEAVAVQTRERSDSFRTRDWWQEESSLSE